MAIETQVYKDWKKVTGVPICEGLGLTEASPVISCNPTDNSGILGSIGLALSSTEIAIVDVEGIFLSEGETGEIIIRGP